MDPSTKEALWRQFGASIDMLENAIDACPEKFWQSDSQFWYFAYHTLFWLDYYLSEEPDKFMPPAPFTLSEFESGIMPERHYSKNELLDYLKFCRLKCHDLITGLTTEKAARRFVNNYMNNSVFELLLYNMRHVQHHTAQLNLMLRQNINYSPNWVGRTKTKL